MEMMLGFFAAVPYWKKQMKKKRQANDLRIMIV
jgi:hypothetical protein